MTRVSTRFSDSGTLFDKGTVRRVTWGVLLVLLVLLLVAAATYERQDRLLPGEATVLMQGESLRHDGDLRYERLDYDRILLALDEPPDLELASGTGGRSVTYDRPFVYALLLLPALWWKLDSGFALLNALLLAVAALFAARGLSRRAGPWGPAWIAALLFATPAFLSVFRADGTAYVVAVLLGGSAVLLGERAEEQNGPWLVAGVLVALAAAWHPLWLVLPVALLLLPHRSSQATGEQRLSLLLGFGLATIVQVVVQWWAGGGLVYALGASFRFTPATGFPAVDFAAADWDQTVARLSALHFEGAPELSWGLDARLWLWNGAYVLVGRHGGLLAYALPLVLAVLGSRRGRLAWLAASVLALVGVLLFHPFDLFGGAAAVGPERLLPLAALAPLAFAALRPAVFEDRKMVAWIALPASVILVAPVLWPAWTSPRAWPLEDDGERAFVSEAAERVLPYETSQQPLPGGPWEDVAGLRFKFLRENGWGESRRDRLVMEGDAEVDLLVTSDEPLDALLLDFGEEAPSSLVVEGAERGEIMLRPSGGVAFEVSLGGGRSHATWWTPERRWFYRFGLSFDQPVAEPLPFEVGVLRAEPGESE